MNESIAKLPERTLSPNSGLLELYERESSFQGFGICSAMNDLIRFLA